MLGKRRKQFAMPHGKKPAYIRTTQETFLDPNNMEEGTIQKPLVIASHRQTWSVNG